MPDTPGVVSQARLLTPAEEESGHHPMHNSYLHNQQISFVLHYTCFPHPFNSSSLVARGKTGIFTGTTCAVYIGEVAQ